MQLVVAEKPSVARDLARVLGVRGAGRHALGDGPRVITWCIGHLVELDEPASYDGRWKAWRLDTLPMIPPTFQLRAVDRTRDQLRAVSELLRDRRFSEVVNACDAGREGELIFRYVYELAGSRLPVRRLWISSMTDEAIQRGFASLRPGADYDALGDAARCRSEADWLVGMNATRAVTVTHRSGPPGPRAPSGGGAGGRGGRGAQEARSPVYSIGRVQTPTLAIVVRREQAIAAFRPQDYWEVRGTFTADGGAGPAAASFTALWGTRADTGKALVTRFGEKRLGEEIVARDRAHGAAADPAGPVVESLRQKKSREPAPQLFDLTSLQRTANRRFGFSATRTLEAAQALYERHKLLTYPRTDARHLSNDLAGEMPRLFRGLAQIPDYAPHARPLLEASPPKSKRVFDDAKVNDHHAIIPTGKAVRLDTLPSDERRVFDLVTRRFLGVFYPDAEFALTAAVIRVGAPAAAATSVASSRSGGASAPGAPEDAPGTDETALQTLPAPPDRFSAHGRVRLVAGWQEVAQIGEAKREERGAAPGKEHDAEAESASLLPPLVEGQRLDGAFDAVAKQTKPPPHHTEATLLGAMEYAGRDIEDETLRAAMKDTGLGTPATRAATIETLVKRGFVSRNGKQLVATAMGIALIDALPVANLASPELTGAWEARLVRIARGQETRAAFMNDIARYVGEVVDAIRGAPAVPGAAAASGAAGPVTPSERGPSSSPPSPSRSAPSRSPLPSRSRPPMASVPAATGRRRATAARGPAPGAAPVLTCPRCKQGTLLTGKRGWGCSRWREGCPFVVWFETAGRRITEAQLRDLVEKGKTRKTRHRPSSAGPETAGRLVLDMAASREAGAARFEPG